jgi:hypothetical protein
MPAFGLTSTAPSSTPIRAIGPRRANPPLKQTFKLADKGGELTSLLIQSSGFQKGLLMNRALGLPTATERLLRSYVASSHTSNRYRAANCFLGGTVQVPPRSTGRTF